MYYRLLFFLLSVVQMKDPDIRFTAKNDVNELDQSISVIRKHGDVVCLFRMQTYCSMNQMQSILCLETCLKLRVLPRKGRLQLTACSLRNVFKGSA